LACGEGFDYLGEPPEYINYDNSITLPPEEIPNFVDDCSSYSFLWPLGLPLPSLKHRKT